MSNSPTTPAPKNLIWASALRDALPGRTNAGARRKLVAQAEAYIDGTVCADSFRQAIELAADAIAFTPQSRHALDAAISEVECAVTNSR